MLELSKARFSLDDLCEIMALLRAPDGCPWDAAQDHDSIRRYFLEEAYEVVDAIDRRDRAALCEELGDVLLQVVFHSAIAESEGAFTLDDVCDGICRKMIHRHPALFGGEPMGDWEQIKQHRYASYGEAMAQVARALPALTRAEKLERKAAQAGFAWPTVDDAFDKVGEELQELRRAAAGDGDVQEELGDLLLAVVDSACLLGQDPERALELAGDKFSRRFSTMERLADGRLDRLPLEEQVRLWQRAKVACDVKED